MRVCNKFALAAAIVLACAATAAADQASPEAVSGSAVKPIVIAQHHMVVAANPYAAEAGRAILRQGGSAIDAAIAVQMVLNLVEPQSSGIGGGGFLVLSDKNSGVVTIDGRETAPAAAKPDRFLDATGKPLDFDAAVNSGLSTGVPGVLAALKLGHELHGKLPWAQLFQPAIALAREGFTISPRLAKLLSDQGPAGFNDEAKAYFFDKDGKPRQAGDVLKNPALADTFEAVATGGPDAFYQGAIARQILAALRAAPRAASDMTADDLATYQAQRYEPVCVSYREHKICGMGPPSSGGTAVAETLALLANFDLRLGAMPEPGHPEALLTDAAAGHVSVLIAEAEKLSFADRDRYIADPNFTPGRDAARGLLDPAYIATRAKLIDPAHPIDRAAPGELPKKSGGLFGIDATIEHSGTSQISIIDDDGSAVSMTTSIETAFGSRLMAGGFLLNNQLTDFSFLPADAGNVAIANRVEGGKRPRSSMAPTLMFTQSGTLEAVLGAPGGPRIILYDVKALICLVDWHCNAEEAADLPSFGSRNGPFEAEQGTTAETALGPAAAAAGEAVKAVDMNTGIHIIVRQSDGTLQGGADRRREGIALGD